MKLTDAELKEKYPQLWRYSKVHDPIPTPKKEEVEESLNTEPSPDINNLQELLEDYFADPGNYGNVNPHSNIDTCN